jgi:hypothetical protein
LSPSRMVYKSSTSASNKDIVKEVIISGDFFKSIFFIVTNVPNSPFYTVFDVGINYKYF